MKFGSRKRTTTAIALAMMSCTRAGVADEGVPGQAAAPDVAAARSLAVEGIRHAEANDCVEAIDKLKRAESLHHAPTILVPLAECQIRMGQVVVGTENLRRVLQEHLASNAPPAFVAAQAKAKSLLEASLPRIATLIISVDGCVPSAVTVDSEVVRSTLLDQGRPTDPGIHIVRAEAPGCQSASAQVELSDGQRETVTLHLSALASSEPSAATSAPSATNAKGSANPARHPPNSQARPERTWGLVALGTGMLGVAVGTTAGLVALTKKWSLDENCPYRNCPASSQGDLDSMKTWGTVSTIGFGVGVAGILSTVVLWMTRPNVEKPSVAQSPTVSVSLTGNGAGLSGSF